MRHKLIIAVIFGLLLQVNAVWGQELIVVSEETPPFNYMVDGVFTGSSTEVVREILRRLKQPDDIRVLTWARGYHMLLSQPNVALYSTTRTEEREQLFHWVGPLSTVRYGFYAKKGAHLSVHSLADAKKVRSIATYKDDAKEQILMARGFTNLDSSKSPVSNLKKLISGRVDLWLFDNLGMPLVARQIGVDPNDLECVFTFRDYELYIAISKGTPEMVVNRWQETLDAMKRDGVFGEISRKWLPEESIPEFQPAEAAGKDEPLSLRIYTEDSPPGNYLENGKLAGLAVVVVREILRRLNQSDTINVVPWARGYNLALSRPNVILFSTTRLPQREKLFKWVGPLYTQTWGFYARQGTGIRIDSLDDARKVARIGTYHNDAKEQFLRGLGFTNLVSANKNISNVKHLVQGNIDLWVSSDFNVSFITRQAGVTPDQIELAYAFQTVHNYIAFSVQTSDEIVAAWQQVFDEMINDGTYARFTKQSLPGE